MPVEIYNTKGRAVLAVLYNDLEQAYVSCMIFGQGSDTYTRKGPLQPV